jgi:hypothetical protein
MGGSRERRAPGIDLAAVVNSYRRIAGLLSTDYRKAGATADMRLAQFSDSQVAHPPRRRPQTSWSATAAGGKNS